MIDTKELRMYAQEVRNDGNQWNPPDIGKADTMAGAADELETLRASESALKAEVRALKEQLQEPQTVRVAPEDMPGIGQALFARRGNQSLLCVRSGEKLLTIIDANGHLFTADLTGLDAWIPVEPPTFPKEGI